MGISREGASAEERFRRATQSTKPTSQGSGDALLDGNLVEVKRATSRTLNQVRAVKYIPLVAFHEPSGVWYVIPPHVVVLLASKKRRGQHTENPFESATLSLGKLDEFRVASESELRAATLAAIRASARFPELKAAMNSVLSRSRDLARESIVQVRGLLSDLGLS